MIDSNNLYFKQAELLVRIIPFVAEEPCFAIKGGTAINLFIRDLPRLSVDIDLVYLPVQDRNSSLDAIDKALKTIAKKASTAIKALRITLAKLSGTDKTIKLFIELNHVRIKVEVSPVLRGTVFPVVTLEVTNNVSELLGYAEALVVSIPDLYAGKICATLDRQHPRDLFDILYLLKNEGITESIFKAFMVYLISHNRPITEIINPNFKDLSVVFSREFKGMTMEAISLDDLYETREQLIHIINKRLNESDKKFLISFKSGKPDWSLLGINGVENLPAVKWKLQNIINMPDSKRASAVNKLKTTLERVIL
jgi:predicted nucleotidyltransferase component of viral defense system